MLKKYIPGRISLPEKRNASHQHMLWIAHNTELFLKSLVLYLPTLQGTGRNEFLFGDIDFMQIIGIITAIKGQHGYIF